MSKQIQNMKILSPNGSTNFYLLIGNEVTNSPSPALHSQWFMSLDMNCLYLPCQIENEDDFKAALCAFLQIKNFQGANITMPFKSTILAIPNLVHSPNVKLIGSANTLYKNKNKQWCLENTDIYGIKKTIENILPKNGIYRLVILGGGGAALSCLYYGATLDSRCSKIFCLTRSPDKTLKRGGNIVLNEKINLLKLDFETVKFMKNVLTNQNDSNFYTLIVNTIPFSNEYYQSKNSLLIELLKTLKDKKTFYFDMLYNKKLAQLSVEECGIPYIDGELMLKEQAKESFFLWTGSKL